MGGPEQFPDPPNAHRPSGAENSVRGSSARILGGARGTANASDLQRGAVAGGANSIWMPSEVDVHAQIGEAFGLPDAGYELYFDRWLRNVQHYTDYQPYRGPMSNNAEPEQSARRNDTEAHPYPEEPLKQLVKRIPDLKGIRPSADQQALSMILGNTGESGRVLRQLSGSDSPRGDYAAKIEPHWGCHKDRTGLVRDS
jgi:hypothetical protein